MKLYLVYNDYNEEAEQCFRTEDEAFNDAISGISEMVEGHGEVFHRGSVSTESTGTICRMSYEFDNGGKIHMMTVHETFLNTDFARKQLYNLAEELA
jgi:hypothetical protein